MSTTETTIARTTLPATVRWITRVILLIFPIALSPAASRADVIMLDSWQGGSAFCNPVIGSRDIKLGRAVIYGHFEDVFEMLTSFRAPACTHCVLALTSPPAIRKQLEEFGKQLPVDSPYRNLAKGNVIFVFREGDDLLRAYQAANLHYSLSVSATSDLLIGSPPGPPIDQGLGAEGRQPETTVDEDDDRCELDQVCFGSSGASFRVCCESICIGMTSSGKLSVTVKSENVSVTLK